ncbi:MAG TPA: bifunctional alpha,alpha-trehalose-phosphate synthase (UDP-forming)/trehalose-phosphatase [Tenuifilaceae bacterium]|nr:bifunctional alpha,alpha-trehalose-phosphate synthase (UDP-forming)/trehalose-phosphatase [Tenuifilaceae bacterium]HPE18195.1 bifunctional alpha,alpha-trehalose-phosphate synthase (UDP-forming)/trehalose-phosphatase [Tenuifilaceae bacterium]HPJ45478.1 bifunctional alpha,alpha-trehalose-phosphate synthase (UDP-forming)/trehalose-phosphatase [Tenuifilaceae bacterium]HPQ33885.1 bifunctional alpha,alpha-trehalose-phosphate synthase (UDP-forming)/trehalose-phosphatase [Tenuifilaceae bacterium]HRX
MSRLIVVSNKLPYEIEKTADGLRIKEKIIRTPSRLSSFYNLQQCDWVGWTGNEQIDLEKQDSERVTELLEQERCHSVCLTADEVEKHHYGFCNATIWPLFHYFTQYSEFREDFWESYWAVNQKFADKVLEVASKDDTIWINDYHLLLLPKMLRDASPDLTIGFFLHIPFPSYEIFRILPWRREIVEGMLGADLVAFHTFDYERHFMSSVRRLLGIDNVLNTVKLDERVVKIDNFPIGIDYKYFQEKSRALLKKGSKSQLGVGEDFISKTLNNGQIKLMLSIDRLDYAKGIDKRLEAYELFLNKYPQYLEKICLALFVIPSREVLVEYQAKKRMVDELVGRINGHYGTVGWMPIIYFYRYLSRDEKVEMYSVSDIALVTPLRDGMNLIAKEYIASRHDGTGVLILSEMTGAAKEMSEALQVNPNNTFEMAEAIRQAMELSVAEQIQSNEVMQKRLQLYNEQKWATDILSTLKSVKKLQETNLTRKISPRIIDDIKESYRKAHQRIIFLDYDGTLTGFHKDPQMAVPNEELYAILRKLVSDTKSKVVIISGRDKETLGNWFADFESITFVAEHGVWIKAPGAEWGMMENIDKNWMDIIRPIINFYADRTPRSFLEEKNYSLVWHYRNSDPDLGVIRAWELKDELRDLVSNLNLEIMDGDKVIEVKNSGINKGRAAAQQLAKRDYQFVMAIGDDWTDEYTFGAMPQNAYTIKVGTKNTKANYYIESVEKVRHLLSTLGNM